MPELPEVETIKRGLEKNVLKKKIAAVEIFDKKTIRSDIKKFSRALVDGSFKKIDRIGKLLIFEMSDGKNFLLAHLKMTGQFIYQARNKLVAGGHKLSQKDIADLPNQFTKVEIKFAGGGKLYLNDMRRFGYLKLVDQKYLEKVKDGYGIDPLRPNFTWPNFQQALSGRQTNIKALLLNQQLIAGVGNIYADEICFHTKVRPDRPFQRLSEPELKKIFRACVIIIDKAIAYGGTTFRDYLDSSGQRGNFVDKLKVYGRTGEKCLRCRADVINKIRVAGRGTHYCPTCQT